MVCAQCSSYRLTLPSSAVVRPPTEVLTPGGAGLHSSQWTGGHSQSLNPNALSNRCTWAASDNNSRGQFSHGAFDWGPSGDDVMGLEDVRVCSDCYSGILGQDNQRGFPGSCSFINRTWSGSTSSTTQSPPMASQLWLTPNLNPAEQHGGRRQNVSKSSFEEFPSPG